VGEKFPNDNFLLGTGRGGPRDEAGGPPGVGKKKKKVVWLATKLGGGGPREKQGQEGKKTGEGGGGALCRGAGEKQNKIVWGGVASPIWDKSAGMRKRQRVLGRGLEQRRGNIFPRVSGICRVPMVCTKGGSEYSCRKKWPKERGRNYKTKRKD